MPFWTFCASTHISKSVSTLNRAAVRMAFCNLSFVLEVTRYFSLVAASAPRHQARSPASTLVMSTVSLSLLEHRRFRRTYSTAAVGSPSYAATRARAMLRQGSRSSAWLGLEARRTAARSCRRRHCATASKSLRRLFSDFMSDQHWVQECYVRRGDSRFEL